MDSTEQYLRNIMARYTVKHARYPHDLDDDIVEMLDQDNWMEEGYKSPTKQRVPSVKFAWGHNHNMGSFHVDGVLKDRHIEILARFIDQHGLPRDLHGQNVMDIGSWTGGMPLLLAGMGGVVDAVEEVRKYGRVIEYLTQQFDLNITTIKNSLYNLDGALMNWYHKIISFRRALSRN